MPKFETKFCVSFVGGGLGTIERLIRDTKDLESAKKEAGQIASTYGHPLSVWFLIGVEEVKQFWLCSDLPQYPQFLSYQKGNRAVPVMLTQSEEQFWRENGSLAFLSLLGKIAEAGIDLEKQHQARRAG